MKIGCSVSGKIIITVPHLQNQGGVTSYYNAVLPHMRTESLLPFEIGNTSGKGSFLHPVFDQLRFNRQIRKVRPALIHVNPSLNLKSFLRDGLFTWQAKKAGIPVVVFFRGWCKNFEKLTEKRLRFFFKKTFGRADAFIVLGSEFNDILRKWGVTAPIYLRTTAVDDNLLRTFSLQKKITRIRKAETIKILFLARLERAKGVFETVDAVNSLRRRGLRLSLTIAGDGPVRNELENYCGKLFPPENSIRFLGFVRDARKAAAFSEHHVYCLPSYSEGLPNSVLEAMAFAMPIVTCPVGGLADLFEENKMGFLCRPKSADDVAGALEKVCTDRQAMIAMAQFNHHYAKNHFMASQVAQQLKDIYQKFILPVAKDVA